jgi:hypothetical protein
MENRWVVDQHSVASDIMQYILNRLVFVSIIALAAISQAGETTHNLPVPLPNAHSHNDEMHQRPLLDALENGFCGIEADVYQCGGKLLVGHDAKGLKPDRTLQKLYLDPLRKRIRENGGRVYRGGPQVFLMLDLKTSPRATYPLLRKTLAEYADIITTFDHGKVTQRALRIVLSGREPRAQLAAEQVRYAGFDGRIFDIASGESANMMPWLSDNWTKRFSWHGDGPMPNDQREKLRGYVEKAHRHGWLIRFWATPDRPEVWRELRAAGVDLINVDNLVGLRKFLLDEKKQ